MLSQISVEMHLSIQILNQMYYEELKKYYYVTPTSYLDLMETFT